LLIDRQKLNTAQFSNDVVAAQEILQHAFRTDLRPIVAEARIRAGGALDPIGYFRENKLRQTLITVRGSKNIATGL